MKLIRNTLFGVTKDKEYPVDYIYVSTKEEHYKDSIGVLDGTRKDNVNVEKENYDGLSKSKERKILPSSV